MAFKYSRVNFRHVAVMGVLSGKLYFGDNQVKGLKDRTNNNCNYYLYIYIYIYMHCATNRKVAGSIPDGAT